MNCLKLCFCQWSQFTKMIHIKIYLTCHSWCISPFVLVCLFWLFMPRIFLGRVWGGLKTRKYGWQGTKGREKCSLGVGWGHQDTRSQRLSSYSISAATAARIMLHKPSAKGRQCTEKKNDSVGFCCYLTFPFPGLNAELFLKLDPG